MFQLFPGIRMKASQLAINRALEKLHRKELSIEDVLDEEDLVTELKSVSFSQLMNILNKDNLLKLIDYIIKEASVDEIKEGHKFPFNSSEILCSDCSFVINKFFDEFKAPKGVKIVVEKKEEDTDDITKKMNDLTLDGEVQSSHIEETPLENTEQEQSSTIPDFPVLNRFFSFLDTKEPLNYVLAGYFFKVISHLFNYRVGQMMNYLFFYKKKYLLDMINHLNRKSIAESMIRVLVSYSSDVQDLEIKKELIEKIMESSQTDNSETLENISELLSDILQNRRIYYIFAKNQKLLEKLHELVINNLSKGRNLTLMKTITKFVENVIKDTQGTAKEKMRYSNNSNQASQETDCLDLYRIPSDTKLANMELDLANYFDIFSIIYDSLDAIIADFIKPPPDNSDFKILGVMKNMELDFFKSLFDLIINIFSNNLINIDVISNNIDILLTKIRDSLVLSYITRYYFQYDLNNYYQTSFEKLLTILVNKVIPEKYISMIFESLNLIELIIQHAFDCGAGTRFGGYNQPGYFASMCEVFKILHSSENVYLVSLVEKNEAWRYLTKVLFLPLKDQLKKGLLYTSLKNESPFQRYTPGDKKEDQSPEKSTPLRELISSARSKFSKYLREKEINSNGEFVNIQDDSIIADIEQRNNTSIPIHNELATSIPLNDGDYYDNNYFWKTYNIDVDLSDL